MTTPRLKWERKWFLGGQPTGFAARSHHVNLYVIKHDGGWVMSAYQTTHPHAHKLAGYIICDEQSGVIDAVDAMATCERRVREVLMADFGELIR
jgi:hypothetical protein